MKNMEFRIVLLLTLSYFYSVSSLPSDITLITTTENSKKSDGKEGDDVAKNEAEEMPTSLKITKMRINTSVANRFAKTLVESHVKNFAEEAKEAEFTVVLPETAYISGFIMEIDGKSYKAYVKEKEEASQIYNRAVAAGQSAGKVEAIARDSNRFSVSINIERNGSAIFFLTYEELLQRKNAQYEVVLNIQPGEIIKDLTIEVDIKESRPLKFVRTPSLRSGNEISKNQEGLEPNTDIQIVNDTSAIVIFEPDVEQQREFAEKLGTNKEYGLAGQFVVQYDVERDPQKGEILLHDGYFVHFFGPDDIPPIPKHVIFLLDISGSMEGRKLDQLREAMLSILPELKTDDVFSIITFGSDLYALNVGDSSTQDIPFESYQATREDLIASLKGRQAVPEAVPATVENIEKAKNMIEKITSIGATNIIGALEVGLYAAYQERIRAGITNSTHHPMILFLTDGQPNEGISYTEGIVNKITELNTGEDAVPIFSLSFGEGADKKFLQKLSHENLGFSRHIYEASDAALQLQNFYNDISSPLLSGVTFEYVKDEITDVTRNKFPIYFGGSELVVAGKYVTPSSPERNSCIHPTLGAGTSNRNFGRMSNDTEPRYCVPIAPVGKGRDGTEIYPSTSETPVPHGEKGLERIWAYLTIKQKLEDRDTAEDKTALTKQAVELALKYSFVTPVTSLVVVKPNASDAVDTEDASKRRPTTTPRPATTSRPTRIPGPTPTLRTTMTPRSYSDLLSRGQPRIQRGSTIYVIAPRLGSGSSFLPIGDITNSEIETQRRLSYILQKYPWILSISSGNTTVKISGHNYDLGLEINIFEDRFRDCYNAGETSSPEPGKCEPLYDCDRALDSLDQYNKHFCVIGLSIAGVCCPLRPSHQSVVSTGRQIYF